MEGKIVTGECKENKNNQIVDDKVSKSDNNHDITSDNGDTKMCIRDSLNRL